MTAALLVRAVAKRSVIRVEIIFITAIQSTQRKKKQMTNGK